MSFETLEEAREFLANNPKGANCPCCERFVRTYKRKLNSGMARTLIHVYRKYGQNPVKMDEFVKTFDNWVGMEYSKLLHWGLLGRTDESGLWWLTDLGASFVRGETTVPRHILLRNKLFCGFSGEQISIGEALGDQFDYTELMAA